MGRPDDPVRDPDIRRSGGPVSRWGEGRYGRWAVVEGDGEEIGNPRSGSWGEGGPACLRLMAALAMGKVPGRALLSVTSSVFRCSCYLSSLADQCRLGPSRIDPIKFGEILLSPRS